MTGCLILWGIFLLFSSIPSVRSSIEKMDYDGDPEAPCKGGWVPDPNEAPAETCPYGATSCNTCDAIPPVQRNIDHCNRPLATFCLYSIGGRGHLMTKEAVAQEGQSFCIVGQHIRHTQLFNSPSLIGFEPLIKHNFNIGNHLRPGEPTKMNILERQWGCLPGGHGMGHIDRNARGHSPLPIPNPYDRCRFRPAFFVDQPQDEACVNPYRVEVTEIHAYKTRLHNYLHIKVFADTVSQPVNKNCATGKIKYLMLEVRDSVGLPVGHFTHDIPCDMDGSDSVRPGPNGIPGIRFTGGKNNHMPCMFTPKRAVSQPGIFLATAMGIDGGRVDNGGNTGDGSTTTASPGGNSGGNQTPSDPYFTEVHATWRFAQHSSHFIPELHFAAMIVENDTAVRYFTSRQSEWWRWVLRGNENKDWRREEILDMCYISRKQKNIRPYGYTALYSKLTLSDRTMGGWDYFRKDYAVPKLVNCHVPLSRRHYTKADGNSQLITWMDILDDNYDKPDDHVTSKFEDYRPRASCIAALGSQFKSFQTLNSFFYDLHILSDPLRLVTKYERMTNVTAVQAQPPTTYFGTKYTQNAYRPTVSSYGPAYEATIDPSIRNRLNRLPNIQEQARPERCPCPALPTTLRSERQPKPTLELDGRRLHAIQMFIAWAVLVPIGMFVARYFKETYSRVFFLQEFWWYSIHVMALITAFLFMVGGIYIVRLNRTSTAIWTSSSYLHAGFGYVLILVYGVHLVLGFFRVWTAYYRILQIMMHWFFGVMEYSAGVTTIYFAAVIPQGYLNCDTFNIYLAFLIVQGLFYLVMDIHLRYVDHKLELKPPRSYLPPPVMRLFHEDAPFSKFRMVMLCLFAITCAGFYTAIHLSLGTTDEHAISCYEHENEDAEELEI